MTKLFKFIQLILILALGFTLFGCGYNSLVQMDEKVNQAWSQVENQYQRRADLIPNLVKTVQGYADFEKGVLVEALSRLLVVAENYPQLKANENFLQLQTQLEGTENRIAVERRKFNEAVQEYNTSVRSFPTLITAKIFGFKDKQYFKSAPGTEKPPDVNFDFNKKESK
jgi:LemA protein